MKINSIYFLVFMTLLWSSCSNTEDIKSDVIPFFPSEYILEQGVANKYYYHGKDFKTSTKTTNVIYVHYLLNNEELIMTEYSSGLKESRKSSYRLEGKTLQLIDQRYIGYRGDTFETEVLKNEIINFGLDSAILHTVTEYDNDIVMNMRYKKSWKKDTIYEGRTAKIFDYNLLRKRENGTKDTIEINRNGYEIYTDGLGLAYRESIDSFYITRLELVEQMSNDDFEKLKNHGTHRVAYIDTTETIDQADPKLICGEKQKIHDYYNGDPDASFKGGKGSLKRYIQKHLDHSKLEGQSGFLTFRFVINCKGEAGWFVTEEADFNYQRKTFSAELRQHLFDILYNVNGWQHMEFDGEAQNAYTYITFKIDNNEIIEILP